MVICFKLIAMSSDGITLPSETSSLIYSFPQTSDPNLLYCDIIIAWISNINDTSLLVIAMLISEFHQSVDVVD